MSKKDNKVKFEELMKLCKEGTAEISAMAFSSEKAINYGLNSTEFNIPTGFYYFSSNEEIQIIGNINKKNISNTAKDNKDHKKSVIVLADLRNEDKPTLLIKDTEILKFNKKTNLEDQTTLVIYWEIGSYSYLAYVLKNSIDGGTLISANFVTSDYQSDINRENCLRLLDVSTCNKVKNLFNTEKEEASDDL